MRNNQFAFGLLLVAALPIPAQNSAKLANVQGTVTNSISSTPVPRAHVVLARDSDGKQARYGATSAADGRFSFTGVAAGSYLVYASRVGFVDTQNGSPRDRVSVSLKGDDNKTGVDLKLIPTGALTGRVTDADGEPLEHVSVQAQGARGGDFDITDDDGRYRIGGLAPGKYTVQTSSRSDYFAGPPEIRTDGTTEVHNVVTYYPGVLTEKEAGRIDVRAGVETPGADIRMLRAPFVRVSGRVVDMPANAHPAMMIEHDHGSSEVGMKGDGTFVLWRLNRGKYTLSADWDGARTVGVPIEVAGSNIDNIELRVVPDSDISGHLEFEDDDARKLPKPDGPGEDIDERRITLIRESVRPASTIDANGAFQIKQVVAGKYRVQVSWGAAYVKSVRLGATTFDGAKLDLMNGAGGAELSVLMGAANSSISGTVQDSKGPATNVVVVLLAADGDSDDEEMDFSSSKYSGTGTDGNYSFDHVAPGNYHMVAVPENELEIRDHQVIGYDDQMESVTVGPKDKITKDLKRRESTPQ
jgi:Carboxypeptidase regulatory-like domain